MSLQRHFLCAVSTATVAVALHILKPLLGQWFVVQLFRHLLHQWSMQGKNAARAAMNQALTVSSYQDRKMLKHRKISSKLDANRGSFNPKIGMSVVDENIKVREAEEESRQTKVKREAKKRMNAWSFVEQTEIEDASEAFIRHRVTHTAISEYIVSTGKSKDSDTSGSGLRRVGGKSKDEFVGVYLQRDLQELFHNTDAWRTTPSSPNGAQILRRFFQTDVSVTDLSAKFEADLEKQKGKQEKLWKEQGTSERREGVANRVVGDDDTFFGFEMEPTQGEDIDLDKDEFSEFGFGPTPQPQRWLRANKNKKAGVQSVYDVHPVLQSMMEEKRREEEFARERERINASQAEERRKSIVVMNLVATQVPVPTTVQTTAMRTTMGTTFRQKGFDLKGTGGNIAGATAATAATATATPEKKKKGFAKWRKSFARKKTKNTAVGAVETRIVTTSVQAETSGYVSATAGDMIKVRPLA